MQIKRSAWLVSLIAVLALVLTACGQAKQSKSSKAQQQITVVLDYTPNTNHSGMYLAMAKGYFKKAGLNVKVVQPPEDGADGLVAAGKAEFGFSYQDVMSPHVAGKDKLPVTAIAAVVQHNTSGIMSRKADNITRPKQMDNKRYATWNLPIEQAIVKTVVNQDGGKFSSIKMVPANFDDEVAALKSQKVDDIWVFEGWGKINADVQGYPVNYFDFRKLNPTFDYYTPVIIGNDAYMKAHPDVTKKFVAAMRQGYTEAAKHPSEASDALMKAVLELKGSKKLIVASQKWLSTQYLAEQKTWGKFDPARWNRFYRWLNDNKLVKSKIPDNTGFTNKYL
ncbi:ABC transporter substrate-binding protein [Lacticaseibacillus saniviri]|uniref:ABC-type nitrate sulfonate bicarbonate transport system, periplasmic component n=1 Tax=Lacticaseibacillus saniviri JCM 17471 = DSM 24301 TaxID=1293598 RepID=A0A0R2MVE3_9LACO|nr:ABC transporter substrate-binding protein [Lacticaseibacillus saniviri]KRO15571.1 ABC-type nitrate sulfonate bicarbonate transport system, periplasmic component [Lacticaseibacillus saniviri JCM 17471 = DSM 24301]MCG4282687.1 ABC transporter substrate-binding protein [Lacticaseibacillus saniviri]